MTTNNQPQPEDMQTKPSDQAVAKAVVQWLEAKPVPFVVTESLARGRAKAVQRMQGNTQQQHVLALYEKCSDYLNQHRLISSLSFISLVLFSFLLVQQLDQYALQNSDALLLASDLPPEAFADKGFDSWIEVNAQL